MTEDQIKDLASWLTGIKEFIWVSMLDKYLPVLMVPCSCDIYDNMGFATECKSQCFMIPIRRGCEQWTIYTGRCEHCSRNFLAAKEKPRSYKQAYVWSSRRNRMEPIF